MPKSVRKVLHPPKLTRKKRVAAYARVSSGKDAMLHSMSAQVSYYSNLIQSHDGWEYVGVYEDEAVTGTKNSRNDFQRMLSDCHDGKIDLILTKSISRFARNTVTLLETVRELKTLGVDIYFEEQNIHSMSTDGELMLTILASYAQEESRSASENQKWRIRRNFEEGKPWNCTMLGYRYKDGQFMIVPEEADIVRTIFSRYLSGAGTGAIMKELSQDAVSTRLGYQWHRTTIIKILKNYAYTGNLILQKTYIENHLSKRSLVNHGELPQYHAAEAHEAIIPLETFEAVQAEIAQRAEKHAHPINREMPYPFTGLLVCGNCGKHYRRRITPTQAVWRCATYETLGKSACASKQIPESTLTAVTADVLGTDTVDIDAIHSVLTEIRAENGNRLVFNFKDGRTVKRKWKDRSRSESWTDEKRRSVGENRRKS
jgi:DNA invertase Pin-like site-specific DNA recombinase